jgi:acetyl esterase/lipase
MTREIEPYGAADGLVRVYPAGPSRSDPTSDGRSTGAGLVWAHGGSFVAGDLDMPEADWVARAFAARGVTVVSVDYRLVTPVPGTSVGEHVFPAGSDDVLAAWSWTLDHADDLGIDPAQLFLGGASAGANLVAGAVLRLLGHAPPAGRVARDVGHAPPAGRAARDEGARVSRPGDPGFEGVAPGLDTLADARYSTNGWALPAGVFLAYPTLLAIQPEADASLRALLDAAPEADHFGRAAVVAMYERYLGGPVEDAPLSAIPGLAEPGDLVGFPPTIIVNDETDELRVSGEAFAASLAAAGVPVDVSTEPGTQHGHLNRPEEPGAAATIERVTSWIARVPEASAHQTTT